MKIKLIPLFILILALPLSKYVPVVITSMDKISAIMCIYMTSIIVMGSLIFRGSNIYEPNKVLTLFILIWVTYCISVLFSQATSPFYDIKGFNYGILGVSITQGLVSLCVVFLVSDIEDICSVMFFLVIIGIVMSLFGLLQTGNIIPLIGPEMPPRTLAGFRFPYSRIQPLGLHFGEYGIFATASLSGLLVLYSWPEKLTKKGKLIVICFLVVVLMGITLGQRRSNWLSACSVIALFFFIKRGKPFRIMGAIVLMALVPYIIEAIRLILIMEEKTVLQRLSGYSEAFSALKNYPFFGTGFHRRLILNEEGKVIHSTFVASMAYLGLVGTSIYMFMFGWLLFTSFQLIRKARTRHIYFGSVFLLLGMSGWFVENNFCLHFRYYQIWIYYGLVCALYGLNKKVRI